MAGIVFTKASTGRSTAWESSDLQDVANQVHHLTGLVDELVESKRVGSPILAAELIVLAADQLSTSVAASGLEGIEAAPPIGDQFLQLLGFLKNSGKADTVIQAGNYIHAAAFGLNAVSKEVDSADFTGLEGTFYRARSYGADAPPSSFGLPPNQGPSRFNASSEKALYVSRSKAALRAELSQTNPGEIYWVQKFEVKPDPKLNLKVLNLTPDACAGSPALNQFVQMSERANNSVHPRRYPKIE